MRDVLVELRDESLLDEATLLLRQISAYVGGSGVQIKAGQSYGYWHVKFVDTDSGRFELWEPTADMSEYRQGADLTLTYWREQHAECSRHQAAFIPPRPDKLVTVSHGVSEGDAAEGTRYPAPSHMSGWYVTTDQYDGDFDTLRLEHMYHLTAARPDLVRYIALPPGFWFDTRSGRVSFSEAIAGEASD